MIIKGAAQRDLGLLLAGAAVSAAGSAVTLVAVLLHLRPLGPGWVAAALAAGLLPVIVLAPLAGSLVDRVANRQLLVAGLALGSISIFGVALFGLAPGRETGLVAGLVLTGVSAALTSPTIAALLPVISGEAGATRAYGYFAALTQGGLLVGSAIAGVLVAAVGIRWALILDASSFAVMALAAAALTAQRDRAALQDRRRILRASPWAGQWEGFRLLLADRLLRVTVAGLAAVILVSIVVNVAEVFFVIENLGLGPAGYGLVTACWPLAGIAGAWLGGRLSTDRRLVSGLVAGAAAMGSAIALAGLIATIPAVVVAWCVAGAANALQVVCIQALVRSRIPDDHRGRAFATLAAVLQSANVVGLAVSAAVVAGLGARLSLIVAGAVTMTVAVVVAVVVGVVSARSGLNRAAGPQQHSVHPAAQADPEDAVEHGSNQGNRG